MEARNLRLAMLVQLVSSKPLKEKRSSHVQRDQREETRDDIWIKITKSFLCIKALVYHKSHIKGYMLLQN